MTESVSSGKQIQRWLVGSVFGILLVVLLLLIRSQYQNLRAIQRVERTVIDKDLDQLTRVVEEIRKANEEYQKKKARLQQVQTKLRSFLDLCQDVSDMPDAAGSLIYSRQRYRQFGESDVYLHLPEGNHELVVWAYADPEKVANAANGKEVEPDHVESLTLAPGNYRIDLRCRENESVNFQIHQESDGNVKAGAEKTLPIDGFSPKSSSSHMKDLMTYWHANRIDTMWELEVADTTWSDPDRYLRLVLKLKLDFSSVGDHSGKSPAEAAVDGQKP